MAGDCLRTHLHIIEAEYARHMCCYFVKFKSIIFFKMQFGGYFVKFYSCHNFQPYGMWIDPTLIEMLDKRLT